jgi:hypothetical protein
MKTRMLVLITVFVLVAAVIFIFASCDNGVVNYGYFMYDGSKHTLLRGFLMDEGPTNDAYYFHFAALSEDRELDEDFTGDGMEIGFFSPTASLAVGTYPFVFEDEPESGDPNTSNGVTLYINVVVEGGIEVGGDIIDSVSGTVTITEVSDNTVAFDFEAVLEDGKTSTGMWSGPVTIQ